MVFEHVFKGTHERLAAHTASQPGCRRCGRTSFHIQTKVCSACGYPSARNRHYNWGKKMIRRKNRGTGRMRYEKDLPRRFKNGFREKVRGLWRPGERVAHG